MLKLGYNSFIYNSNDFNHFPSIQSSNQIKFRPEILNNPAEKINIATLNDTFLIYTLKDIKVRIINEKTNERSIYETSNSSIIKQLVLKQHNPILAINKTSDIFIYNLSDNSCINLTEGIDDISILDIKWDCDKLIALSNDNCIYTWIMNSDNTFVIIPECYKNNNDFKITCFTIWNGNIVFAQENNTISIYDYDRCDILYSFQLSNIDNIISSLYYCDNCCIIGENNNKKLHVFDNNHKLIQTIDLSIDGCDYNQIFYNEIPDNNNTLLISIIYSAKSLISILHFKKLPSQFHSIEQYNSNVDIISHSSYTSNNQLEILCYQTGYINRYVYKYHFNDLLSTLPPDDSFIKEEIKEENIENDNSDSNDSNDDKIDITNNIEQDNIIDNTIDDNDDTIEIIEICESDNDIDDSDTTQNTQDIDINTTVQEQNAILDSNTELEKTIINTDIDIEPTTVIENDINNEEIKEEIQQDINEGINDNNTEIVNFTDTKINNEEIKEQVKEVIEEIVREEVSEKDKINNIEENIIENKEIKEDLPKNDIKQKTNIKSESKRSQSNIPNNKQVNKEVKCDNKDTLSTPQLLDNKKKQLNRKKTSPPRTIIDKSPRGKKVKRKSTSVEPSPKKTKPRKKTISKLDSNTYSQSEIELFSKIDDMLSIGTERILKNIERESEQREKQFNDAITQLEQTCTNEIKNGLNNAFNNKTKQIIANMIRSGIRTDIQNALREPFANELQNAFNTTLGPQIEDSCQKLFIDVDKSFQASITKHAQLVSATDNVQQLSNAVTSLSQVCNAMVSTVANLVTLKTSLPVSMDNNFVPPPNVKEMISICIDNKDYSQAIFLAVEAKDLSIVVYTIELINDPNCWLQSNSLNQSVLLALIQQLSSNLSIDTEIKLKWIKNGIIVLEKDNDNIGSNVILDVINQLCISLENTIKSNISDSIKMEIQFMIPFIKHKYELK